MTRPIRKMSAQCENCQFWALDENNYSEVIAVKRCKYAIHTEDATEWNDDYDRVLKPEFSETKAFTVDGSGYIARLYTKSDFGCNQHKERE